MDPTRVLVVHSSKNGSTAEIASAIADGLKETGSEVDVADVRKVRAVDGYEIVVVGSAIYTGRWRKDAIKFLHRFADDLACREVWLFDSGPLDRSADAAVLPLPSRVEQLAHRIGIVGHVTFGGKLDETTKGFVARSMVKQGRGGDFRNFERVRRFAREIVRHEQWLTGPAPVQRRPA